jgi:hypothetical protein
MKNYFEFHGTSQQLVFDPISKIFTTRTIPHGFASNYDAGDARLLDDLGLDKAAASFGQLKIAA